jgi:hypothetical protein
MYIHINVYGQKINYDALYSNTGHPPAPQPDQMRDGALQRYNQQYSKLLKEGTEKKEIVDQENNLKSLHIKESLKRPFLSDQLKESVQITEQPVDKSTYKDTAEKSGMFTYK